MREMLRIVISHATTPFRIVLFLLDSWQHHGCCEVSQVFFGIKQNSLKLGCHTRYVTYKYPDFTAPSRF